MNTLHLNGVSYGELEQRKPHGFVQGTKWDQVGPSGTKWDQVGPRGTKWDQVGPSGTKWYQVGPRGTKWDQVGPVGGERSRKKLPAPFPEGLGRDGRAVLPQFLPPLVLLLRIVRAAASAALPRCSDAAIVRCSDKVMQR